MENAGEVWEAVSSRIISARLKWVHTGKKKGGWSGKASGTYVSVVCAYEPTAKAPSSIKLKFYDDLQDTIVGFHIMISLLCWVISMLGWVCWTQGIIYGKVL